MGGLQRIGGMLMKQVGIAILGFLLASAMSAQVVIEGMTLADLTITTVATGGPTCSGSISESFDGVGYDLSWTETTTNSGVVDEDDTTRTETYFVAEDLHVKADAADSQYNTYTNFSATDPYFIATAVYFASEDLSNETNKYFIWSGAGSAETVCAVLGDTGGQFYMELKYADGCGSTTSDTYNISLDTVYVVQLNYENIGASSDTVGWKIWDCGADGTSCSTTPDHTYTTSSVEAGTSDTTRVRLGGLSGVGSFYDAYFGFVEIATTEPCS